MIGHLGSAHLGNPSALDTEVSSLHFVGWARGSGLPYPAKGICAIGGRGVRSSFLAEGARAGNSSPVAGGLGLAAFGFDIAPRVYVVGLDSASGLGLAGFAFDIAPRVYLAGLDFNGPLAVFGAESVRDLRFADFDCNIAPTVAYLVDLDSDMVMMAVV